MKLQSPNIAENKMWESLEWKFWEFGNESEERENEERKGMREIKREFTQIPSSLAILYSRE